MLIRKIRLQSSMACGCRCELNTNGLFKKKSKKKDDEDK
jgi:hypothetical protein